MGVKRFVWDEVSDNVLLETDETDTVTARYCQCPETFGELLFQDRSGTKSFFHYDGSASTCNLTNSSESVTDTTLYSAYGEKVASTGATINPFGYKGAVGYYTNESTGEIYVRNRSYEPNIGRWMSKDLLGFIDGTSLYRAYFMPNGVDPLGLACRPPRRDDFPESIMPDDDPYWPVPRWTTWQDPSPIPIAGADRLVFYDQECGDCIMDITVIAKGIRYYRESPNGGYVGWNGGILIENYPRDFAGFLYVKACFENIRCECANKPDYEEVYTRIFYSCGLGTYIEWKVRGMRSAAASFVAKNPCNVGEEVVDHIRRTSKLGDGIVVGVDGTTDCSGTPQW